MQYMIKNVKDFSEYKEKKFQLRMGWLTVWKIRKEIENIFRMIAFGKQIKLDFQTDPPDICSQKFYNDFSRIVQVLFNLVQNAFSSVKEK